ncbi:hypothetical protein F2P81_001150 [Scophthalmus maximus]|uniref:Uncharacterized protein n=1 Tax=Scophthalmus maximus TaxID=52904 RepID=A0A6A4TKW3_SCOMX|nr:hypothetical protein F2P81_001150 [Scophthalmus maximus]
MHFNSRSDKTSGQRETQNNSIRNISGLTMIEGIAFISARDACKLVTLFDAAIDSVCVGKQHAEPRCSGSSSDSPSLYTARQRVTLCICLHFYWPR